MCSYVEGNVDKTVKLHELTIQVQCVYLNKKPHISMSCLVRWAYLLYHSVNQVSLLATLSDVSWSKISLTGSCQRASSFLDCAYTRT